PTEALRAAADGAAEAEAGEEFEASYRATAAAAIAANDEAGAKDYLSLRGQNARVVRGFPRAGNEGGEAAAGRRIFRTDCGGRIAVDVCGAHLDPDRRRVIDFKQCAAEDEGGFNARAENFVLVVGRFDAIDSAAREVDQADGAVERRAPVAKRSGVPG